MSSHKRTILTVGLEKPSVIPQTGGMRVVWERGVGGEGEVGGGGGE